jgi:L-rhamnose isomerase
MMVTVSTVMSMSLLSVVPDVANADVHYAKKKCDQSALATYNAYHDASRAIVAAYKTVVEAAKVTYRAAKQSGIPSVRKAANANYKAALANARSTRAAALSALGAPPHVPRGCKAAEIHS